MGSMDDELEARREREESEKICKELGVDISLWAYVIDAPSYETDDYGNIRKVTLHLSDDGDEEDDDFIELIEAIDNSGTYEYKTTKV